MTVNEILSEIQRIGGQIQTYGNRLRVEAPKGRLSPELKEAVAICKPELLNALRTRDDVDNADLDQSASRLEQMNVALRIESEELGTVWIVSSERYRCLADTTDPIYTVTDARHLVQLAPSQVRLLNSFMKQFGGTVEWKQKEDQP
jgi:hypothetical protein